MLMYVATVILKRTEKQFWRMSPRKLNALVKAHITINGTGEQEGEGASQPKQGFIDQLF